MNVSIPGISSGTCNNMIHAVPHLCVWSQYRKKKCLITLMLILFTRCHAFSWKIKILKCILMRVLITSYMCLFSWSVLAGDGNFQAVQREKYPQASLLCGSLQTASPLHYAPNALCFPCRIRWGPEERDLEHGCMTSMIIVTR